MTSARRGERGFTLIELMIALVVSSLLVGMILAIFNRMSTAYRGQQQISGLQQVLAATRSAMEQDAKQAGLLVPQGFAIHNEAFYEAPLQVINNRSSKGADQVAFFYADPSVQGRVSATPNWTNDPTVTLQNTAVGTFTAGDLAVIVDDPNPGTDYATVGAMSSTVLTVRACVLRVRLVSGLNVHFSVTAPYGAFTEPHCNVIASSHPMMYRFVAHAYRIDNATSDARTAQGPLQMSATGGIFANDWTDVGYGFTDLQIALRAYDATYAAGDADGDGDGSRDWYSGDDLTTITATHANGAASPMASPANGFIQMAISLVARTDRDVEGVATTSTPSLIDATHPANNPVGDRAAIALPSTDPALTGERVYRYTSFRVDVRNLGVGL